MGNALDAATVAADLLALLRANTESRDAAYSHAPARILGGYDTVVYGFQLANAEGALGRPLILRMFDGEFGSFRARIESAMQNAIAAQGYDCPRVLVTGDEAIVAGEHFTVMERLTGTPIIDAVLSPGVPQLRLLLRLSGMFARRHARLHDLDAAEFARFVRAVASPDLDLQLRRLSSEMTLRDIVGRIEEHDLDELRPALRWVTEHRPPAPSLLSICHGDFHFGNVLLKDGEISGVVDWSGVRLADPALDVARTVIAALYGPVDMSRLVRPLSTPVRRVLNARYVSAYRRLRRLDRSTLDYYEAFVALAHFSQGYARALASPEALTTFPWAFESAARGLARHFRAKTGITLDRRRLSAGAS